MTDQTEALRAVKKAIDYFESGGPLAREAGLATLRSLLATPPAEGLGVERLAVAMNTAQLKPEEFSLGRDLRIPARRILTALGTTPAQDWRLKPCPWCGHPPMCHGPEDECVPMYVKEDF